ncbi:SGNH/GDSL hydrolase family protein [Phaeobacter sp.]|uniref:SGNH/GDSL hydrolase family protein n=1 Tax=Phaeobacter sp. TaxID=1902409 RepID=UPI0025CE19B0|nr:SGNH/GDSL hydrolase family protein [Phaeobacter sp.]
MIILLCLLTACGRGVPDDARIIVAGDSVMAWNRGANQSVAARLSARLQQPVGDVSLSFARITDGPSLLNRGPLNITRQAEPLRAEWVILNGGANDLRANCGCQSCNATLDQLITRDASDGAIPTMVRKLRQTGARVIWVEYYTAPRFANSGCLRPYRQFEQRLARMAAQDAGVTLIDLDATFSPQNTALFAADRLHPSALGSDLIAAAIAAVLQPQLRASTTR